MRATLSRRRLACVFGGHTTEPYSGSVSVILIGPNAAASSGTAVDATVVAATAAATALPTPVLAHGRFRTHVCRMPQESRRSYGRAKRAGGRRRKTARKQSGNGIRKQGEQTIETCVPGLKNVTKESNAVLEWGATTMGLRVPFVYSSARNARYIGQRGSDQEERMAGCCCCCKHDPNAHGGGAGAWGAVSRRAAVQFNGRGTACSHKT